MPDNKTVWKGEKRWHAKLLTLEPTALLKLDEIGKNKGIKNTTEHLRRLVYEEIEKHENKEVK